MSDPYFLELQTLESKILDLETKLIDAGLTILEQSKEIERLRAERDQARDERDSREHEKTALRNCLKQAESDLDAAIARAARAEFAARKVEELTKERDEEREAFMKLCESLDINASAVAHLEGTKIKARAEALEEAAKLLDGSDGGYAFPILAAAIRALKDKPQTEGGE